MSVTLLRAGASPVRWLLAWRSFSCTPARFCVDMPSTHTTQARPHQDPPAAPEPTPRQMRHLRDLADRLGQTFTFRPTRHQAGAEIRGQGRRVGDQDAARLKGAGATVQSTESTDASCVAR